MKSVSALAVAALGLMAAGCSGSDSSVPTSMAKEPPPGFVSTVPQGVVNKELAPAPKTGKFMGGRRGGTMNRPPAPATPSPS